MSNEFEESLALQAIAAGLWKGCADPRRQAMNGMYGGWTAAFLLKTVLAEQDGQAAPSAMTIHFLKAIAPGSEVTVKTYGLGRGRSLSFHRADLEVAGTDGLAATATVVQASRKETKGFTDHAMPSVPPPEALPEVHPPGTFGERSVLRPAAGHPPFNRSNTQSVTWVRETSGRALDYVQLAYLSDNYAPRTYLRSSGPGPYSTITMSVYFHANEKEMNELGDDYILLEAVGTRAESSTVGAHGWLWSRGGALLATTEQLGWFK